MGKILLDLDGQSFAMCLLMLEVPDSKVLNGQHSHGKDERSTFHVATCYAALLQFHLSWNLDTWSWPILKCS